MEARRAVPASVAAVVLGVLGFYFLKDRGEEAKPRPIDAESDSAKSPRESYNPFAVSGKDPRFSEGAPPANPPPGHPAIPGVTAPGSTEAPPAEPAHPTPAGSRGDGGGALPVTYAAPAGWTEKAASGMRKAQWSLAGDGGDVVIFFFEGNGGNVMDNVKRWEKQFEGAPEATTKEIQVAAMKVTRVAIAGTFSGSSMPGTPAQGKKGDWRMLGAIVESPGGMVFVKATGPAAALAREEANFDAFLASFKAK